MARDNPMCNGLVGWFPRAHPLARFLRFLDPPFSAKSACNLTSNCSPSSSSLFAINRKFPIAAPLPSCCICLPVGWLARSLRDRPTYCVRVCARVVCVCVYFARSFIKIRADARVISSRHGVVLDFGESFYEERSVCVCVCLHVRAACLPFAKRAACRLVYPSPPSPSSTLLWRGVDDIYPFPRFSKNDLTLPRNLLRFFRGEAS